MHTQNSVQKIPSVIKPFVFARGGLSFIGEFDLATLPRVKEIVTHRSFLQISISFRLEEDRIIANGQLIFDAHLSCVNCLEDVVFHCDKELHLVFMNNSPDNMRDEVEFIEITDIFAEFYTREFIAEEVLLNLPMFVKHDYECINLEINSEGGQSSYTQKPFANLKKLYT